MHTVALCSLDYSIVLVSWNRNLVKALHYNKEGKIIPELN
jgi:hypothetical protein